MEYNGFFGMIQKKVKLGYTLESKALALDGPCLPKLKLWTPPPHCYLELNQADFFNQKEIIMYPITKKLVTNEAMQPIAVQIDYGDWLKIEPLLLRLFQKPMEPPDDLTVWQNQWCELAQKIDKAWKSHKSAVEVLGEMRR